MLNMSRINHIRELDHAGYKVAEIARKAEVDEKTVRKYLGEADFSPKPPEQEEKPSKLDPFNLDSRNA